MIVTLLQIVQSTQTLKPSQWYWDINHFATGLEITVEQVTGFIKCIEIGGTGIKADG